MARGSLSQHGRRQPLAASSRANSQWARGQVFIALDFFVSKAVSEYWQSMPRLTRFQCTLTSRTCISVLIVEIGESIKETSNHRLYPYYVLHFSLWQHMKWNIATIYSVKNFSRVTVMMLILFTFDRSYPYSRTRDNHAHYRCHRSYTRKCNNKPHYHWGAPDSSIWSGRQIKMWQSGFFVIPRH